MKCAARNHNFTKQLKVETADWAWDGIIIMRGMWFGDQVHCYWNICSTLLQMRTRYIKILNHTICASNSIVIIMCFIFTKHILGNWWSLPKINEFNKYKIPVTVSFVRTQTNSVYVYSTLCGFRDVSKHIS